MSTRFEHVYAFFICITAVFSIGVFSWEAYRRRKECKRLMRR